MCSTRIRCFLLLTKDLEADDAEMTSGAEVLELIVCMDDRSFLRAGLNDDGIAVIATPMSGS